MYFLEFSYFRIKLAFRILPKTPPINQRTHWMNLTGLSIILHVLTSGLSRLLLSTVFFTHWPLEITNVQIKGFLSLSPRKCEEFCLGLPSSHMPRQRNREENREREREMGISFSHYRAAVWQVYCIWRASRCTNDQLENHLDWFNRSMNELFQIFRFKRILCPRNDSLIKNTKNDQCKKPKLWSKPGWAVSTILRF